MASRAEQKAQARAERIAREQAEATAKVRRQRITMGVGIVVVAVIIAVVAIAIASHKGKATSASAATDTTSTVAQATDARVKSLLTGLSQNGTTLGKANAPISVIEYGDLECSVCDAFALSTSVDTSDGTPGSGVEDQIINDLVKTGKANLVYKSLDTATSGGATPNMFDSQQAAAYAAGMQNKGWNYIELFYNEQGAEGTDYVTDAYLEGIAKQIPGLDYTQWMKDWKSTTLTKQVEADVAAGTKVDQAAGSGASTPTVLVKGPKGEQIVSLGIPAYSDVVKAIKSVS